MKEDDENYAGHYNCRCGEELEKGAEVECDCGAEYDRTGQRIWPDDYLKDLQTT